MEEKEIKKTPKKTTTKKSTSSKTTKKASSTKKTSTTKKTTTKKTSTTKKTTTKRTPKKVEKNPEVVETIIEEKNIEEIIPEKEQIIEETTIELEEKKPEENLEKTIIIDNVEKQNIDEVVDNLEEENIVLTNKVIKRSKAKKISIIIISVLIVITIIISSVYVLTKYNEQNKNQSSVDSNLLEKVKEQQNDNNNVEETTNTTKEYYENIKNITLKDFEAKILDGEDLNIIIFSSTCYACANFETVMQPILKDLDVTLNKIDVIQLSESERDVLDGYFNITMTPTIYTVRDGVVKSELVGTLSDTEFRTWAEENLK